MARITIIGGHGKIALRLTRRLSDQGHEVMSWIRNAGHSFDVKEAGGTPIIANIEHLTADAMSTLMEGHDAIVWSAGAGGGDPTRTYAVDRDAAMKSIDAAEAAGADRYIMVSYFYPKPEHGVSPDVPFFHYAEAKVAADAHLRNSSLNWTILGPSALTDEPGTGAISTSAESGTSVTRDDVAAVAAEVIDRKNTVGKTIDFNNGETAITDALAAI